MRRFIYERSATNMRDWSLAYSFICSIVFISIGSLVNSEEKKIEHCFILQRDSCRSKYESNEEKSSNSYLTSLELGGINLNFFHN